MFNGRHRSYPGMFERKEIRGAMRCLKQGRVLWYAPDQDYGSEHSVFVPFFGNLAATITAGSRFAKFNESPVIFSVITVAPTTPDTTFISAKC